MCEALPPTLETNLHVTRDLRRGISFRVDEEQINRLMYDVPSGGVVFKLAIGFPQPNPPAFCSPGSYNAGGLASRQPLRDLVPVLRDPGAPGSVWVVQCAQGSNVGKPQTKHPGEPCTDTVRAQKAKNLLCARRALPTQRIRIKGCGNKRTRF